MDQLLLLSPHSTLRNTDRTPSSPLLSANFLLFSRSSIPFELKYVIVVTSESSIIHHRSRTRWSIFFLLLLLLRDERNKTIEEIGAHEGRESRFKERVYASDTLWPGFFAPRPEARYIPSLSGSSWKGGESGGEKKGGKTRFFPSLAATKQLRRSNESMESAQFFFLSFLPSFFLSSFKLSISGL